MKFRRVASGYLIRLERGEEAIASLASFAAQKKIPCGTIQGIGAVKDVTLGYFDTRRRAYRTKKVRNICEVLSLTGNISYLDDKPYVHTHIILAGARHNVLGGHFFSGTVAITLEIFIHVISKRLCRVYDREAGFNFWDLS